MVELHEDADGRILIVQMSGKLTAADYQYFLPKFDRLIKKYGKIRVLCHMHDFHGWQLGALWKEIMFEVKHFSHIERLALVSDRNWEAAMAIACRPFTTAAVKYFDEHELEQASEWIWSDLPRVVKHAASVRHVVREASEESFPVGGAPAF